MGRGKLLELQSIYAEQCTFVQAEKLVSFILFPRGPRTRKRLGLLVSLTQKKGKHILSVWWPCITVNSAPFHSPSCLDDFMVTQTISLLPHFSI